MIFVYEVGNADEDSRPAGFSRFWVLNGGMAVDEFARRFIANQGQGDIIGVVDPDEPTKCLVRMVRFEREYMVEIQKHGCWYAEVKYDDDSIMYLNRDSSRAVEGG